MAQSDFHAVDAVDGGVSSGGAAQSGDLCVGHETHVHKVILDSFRKIESHQDARFTYRQLAQHPHTFFSTVSDRAGVKYDQISRNSV